MSLRGAAVARRGNPGNPRTLSSRSASKRAVAIPWRTLIIAIALASAAPASAQTYPSKPIRIITTVTGGSQDLTARIIAPRLGETLGQKELLESIAQIERGEFVTGEQLLER